LSDFDGDELALVNHQMAKFSPKGFFKTRKYAIGTFGANAVLRNALSLPKPASESVWFTDTLSELVPSLAEYRTHEKPSEISLNLSPQLCNWFGPTWRGEVTMAIAAAADAFRNQLDLFRAIVEVNICDSIEARSLTAESMVEHRNQIEEKLLALAPPKGRGASPADSVDWMSEIDQFLDRSITPVSWI
jgi:hypothetical protein